MRLLLIKTSSLGDVIHALPAVTDAAALRPGLRVDWVVEAPFAEIPGWHPAVDRVIPVSLRRWRRRPPGWRRELAACWRAIRARRYDLVLDAQGLVKSAALACAARGPRAGYDRASAREPLAALSYGRRLPVDREQHAIVRQRQLMARALGAEPPGGPHDFGLAGAAREPRRQVVLLHGTTWASKRWPEACWTQLAEQARREGFEPLLPSGNADERALAERVAEASGGRALPPSTLSELAQILRESAGVIACDTGLAHLAAALDVPAVALYGPTRADLTGLDGPRQRSLTVDFSCAPCLLRDCPEPPKDGLAAPCWTTVPPEHAWRALRDLMPLARGSAPS